MVALKFELGSIYGYLYVCFEILFSTGLPYLMLIQS